MGVQCLSSATYILGSVREHWNKTTPRFPAVSTRLLAENALGCVSRTPFTECPIHLGRPAVSIVSSVCRVDLTILSQDGPHISTRNHKRAWPEEDEMRELNRLKDWLCLEKTQARQERERAERRERKAEDAARREAEQPALFQLWHDPVSV